MSEQNSAKIHLLDTLTANQIAAGEVIERPASVIKELVENAIDAGATAIEITIFDRSCEKMQVADNGSGMNAADMQLCLVRHATSKISRTEDLNNLHTLGFRGEALPSIASVSRLTLTSKTADAETARQIVCLEGKIISDEEVAAGNGTTVLVEQLFYNTPARKKFLRSANTELAAISDVISNLALSHLDIAFTLKRGNHRAIVTRGNNDLSQAVIEILGRETAKNLLHVSFYDEENGITVSGLASVPSFNRASRPYKIFVNKRPVSSRELNSAIEESYFTLLPAQRYPLICLFLELPPHSFDVNVHPAKLEIKLLQPEPVKHAISTAISQALAKKEAVAPRFHTAVAPGQIVSSLPEQKPVYNQPSLMPQFSVAERQEKSGIELFHELYSGLRTANRNLSQISQIQNSDTDATQAQASMVMPSELFSRHLQPAEQQILKYSSLHIIGQYLGTFILAAGENGLYIIDQHAAAERVTYEKLAAEVDKQPTVSTMLAVPTNIQLSQADHLLLVDNITHLADLGFVLEYFGDTTYIVRGLPFWCDDDQAHQLLLVMIDLLASGNLQGGATKLRSEELFLAACKKSIKANRYLTSQDISALLAELDKCQVNSSCPHGRPIAILLTENEIRRRFLRSSK